MAVSAPKTMPTDAWPDGILSLPHHGGSLLLELSCVCACSARMLGMVAAVRLAYICQPGPDLPQFALPLHQLSLEPPGALPAMQDSSQKDFWG